MCSVPDDDTEVNFMENEPALSNLDGQNCKKCSTNKAGVLLRRKDVYCNSCFIESVTHKFRASLGKTKIVRHGDKVLVAFSGDGSSCTLMDLVKTGLKEDTHKKLKFEPVAVYIDEGVIFNESPEERIKNRNRIYDLISINQYPITLFSSALSDVFKIEPTLSQDVNESIINEELDNRVKQLIWSIKNLTTKQDLCKKLRLQLLLKCAKKLDCKFIFLADTATKLASTLLCNVSLGAGSHLSSDVSFCDSRDKIKILRPLKDFTSEELEYFLSLSKISHIIDHRSFITDNDPYASIQSLTNKFVEDLQENFPATISTVLRTGEKLENKSIDTQSSEEDTCAVCLSLLDTGDTACSSLQATNYSKLVSNLQDTTSPDVNAENGSCQNSARCGDCHCQSTGNSVSKEDVEKFLCYSCRLILKDVEDVNLLPANLLSSVMFKKSLADTRNEIKDFLL